MSGVTVGTTLRQIEQWLTENELYLELKARFDTKRGRLSYRAYLRNADRKIVCVATSGAPDIAIATACDRWQGMQPRTSLVRCGVCLKFTDGKPCPCLGRFDELN